MVFRLLSWRPPKFKNALRYFCCCCFLPSVTNRRLALKRMRPFLLPLRMRMIREHARARTWRKMVDVSQASSLQGSTNTMISSPLKPDTNTHTVCGRPTLKGFERFRKGSLRGLYERSIYERTFLSEPIENHAISNELSNVNHVKKHLHKHYRVSCYIYSCLYSVC